MESDIYALPVSFYVVCIMSSMAFVVCSVEWLLRAWRGGSSSQSFFKYVWAGQLHIFFFILILSLLIAFYDYFAAGASLNILGELIILLGVYVMIFKGGRDFFVARALSFTNRYVVLGLFCLLGWCMTLAVGGGLYMICTSLTVMNSNDFMVAVVFLTGLMWVAPIVFLYLLIIRNKEKRPVLEGRNIAAFLWPVLLAYFILLIPLVTQSTINSQEWQDAKRAKPVKQI